MTLHEWLLHCIAKFEAAQVFLGHGTDNYWDEALHLTLPLLGIEFDAPESILESVLSSNDRALLNAALKRRVEERVPTPYITQQGWFCGMPFFVDERVLIPRSPIGELIGQAFAPWVSAEPKRVLDMCTGSACIAIACAELFPKAYVDAVDIDPSVLQVAKINVDEYGVGERLRLVQSDMFQALAGEKYDLIVCNPPYVDGPDMASLPPEFLHEPRLALESGADGLDFTRQFLRQVGDFVTDDAVVILEVGNSWEALEQVYPDVPFTWLEFADGGSGVCLLHAADIRACQPLFDAACV